MAASRIKVMDPGTILDRLTDQFNILSSDNRAAPSRHQTVLATINWSNELLNGEERILFYRLSVFTGDFDLEDAEKICGYDPLSEFQVLDLLTHLVDKSLVITVERNGATRYVLLEIMKQYGVQKLSENEELNIQQDQYCNFYLEKASVAYGERLKNSGKWLGWLDFELNNLHGVFSILRNEPTKRLKLASYLAEFFYLQSNLGVGCEILSSALEASTQKSMERALILNVLGFLELYYMNSDLGYQKMKEGSKLIQELGDKQAKLDVYCWYGMAKTIYKEWDDAREILEEGLLIARDNKDPWMEIRYKIIITWIPINQLNPELIEAEAGGNLEEAIRLGNVFDITVARHIYADIPLQKGDFKLSEIRYMEAAKNALELGSALQVDIELQGMAMSIAGQGRHEKALQIFGAAIGKFEEIGAELVALNFWMTCINRTVGKSIEILGPEKAEILNQEGRKMGFEKAIEYAFDLDKD
jgi:non-specific serine/threonine protein kinase